MGTLSSITLDDLATNGDLLVAVGSNGTLLTSADGLTWNDVSIETLNDFRKVLWNGEQWLAIGSNDVVLSADGITWVQHESVISSANDIVWTGEQYVVVGDGRNYLSTDGVTWLRDNDQDIDLEAVTWTGNSLLGVDRGVGIYQSYDAQTWELTNPIELSSQLVDVEYSNDLGVLIVLDNNRAYRGYRR